MARSRAICPIGMLAVVAAVWFSPPGVWLIPLAAAFRLALHGAADTRVRTGPQHVGFAVGSAAEHRRPAVIVVIGVDAHKKPHTHVALDGNGRKLAQKTVEATDAGHAKALARKSGNGRRIRAIHPAVIAR